MPKEECVTGKVESIKLDFDSMPEFVKNDLAAAAWDAVQRFMERPDAQTILDAERERLRREGNTLLDPRPLQVEGGATRCLHAKT